MKAANRGGAWIALALVALAGLGAAWLLKQPASPPLAVLEATAAPIAGQPGAVAVFAKIDNPGGPDRLTAVASPRAAAARIDGPAAALAIPAASRPSLAADGAHLRLDGVEGDLTDGQLIPVTLQFDRAGAQRLQARLVAPRAGGAAAGFGLFGLGDICRVGEGEPAPEIALSVERGGAGWVVTVDARDFSFEPDLVDGPHIPGTGHGHLYLNGLKLQRLYAPRAEIGALPPGRHRVTVTLNTNDHRAYVVGDAPVTASAEIEIP